ncbi:MAG: thymidylate synthase [Planctomycetota bacterium]
MLAGRNDVEWLAYFNANIANYSDDGEKFHGAYGYRWRKHFEGDQLMDIARALKANHDCRRQVLQIWDACDDLGRCSKDLPCNLTVHFQIGGTRIRPVLNMTVFNRSNDVVWGAYGANAVHFSMLQEYMANKRHHGQARLVGPVAMVPGRHELRRFQRPVHVRRSLALPAWSFRS